MTLAEAYQEEGRVDELAVLLRWAEQTVPMGWEGFYAASEHYREAGRRDLAVEFMMKAADGLIGQYGNHPSATYDNALALASILLNNYREFDLAEDVYRRAIAMRPESYAGVHELAATLQADNRPSDALQAVLEYIQEHGGNDSANSDRDILMDAMKRAEPTQQVLPEVPAEP
jgi:tetratricopeptide (TPR) repeat protein